MNDYLQDVLDQPSDLRGALAAFLPDVRSAAERISATGRRKVVFTGMGSSHFCGRGAAIVLESAGYSCTVLSCGELLHYETALLDDRTLLVLVSQSGESTEVVQLLDRVPEGCLVVGVTDFPGSALARRADFPLFLHVRPEVSVTTRTYLASVLLLDVLAQHLAGSFDAGAERAVHVALDGMDRFLAENADLAERISRYFDGPASISLIGRGYSLSSVQAGALFYREVAKFPAVDFDGGEFRHGPIEMVDETFRGIVFAPDGPAAALGHGLARRISACGGRCVLVTDRTFQTPEGGRPPLVVTLPAVPGLLSPLLEILPVQLHAAHFAKERGFTPGVFRWSSKVTKEEF